MMQTRVLSALLVAGLFLLARPAPATAPPLAISGTWEISVEYILGTGTHRMTLQQNDGTLTGTYHSQHGTEVPLQGTLNDSNIEFTVRMRHQGPGLGAPAWTKHRNSAFSMRLSPSPCLLTTQISFVLSTASNQKVSPMRWREILATSISATTGRT